MSNRVRPWHVALTALALMVMGACPASELGALLARADAGRTGDPGRFRTLLAQAEDLQAQASDSERDHLALLHAYRDWRSGDYGKAIVAARRVAERADEPAFRYRATLLVANLAAVTRDYSLGADYLARAGALESTVDDPAVRELGLGVAAALYNQFGQPELAERYARQLRSTARLPRSRCLAHENLARALVSQRKVLDETRDLIAPVAVCEAANEPICVSFLHASRARYLVQQKRHAEAVALLRAHLDTAQATRYTRLVAEYQSLIAEALLQLDDLDGAAAAARRAIALSESDTHPMPMLDAHRVLYEVHKQRGDLKASLHHLDALATGERQQLRDLQERERAYHDQQVREFQQQRVTDTLRHENQTLQLERSLTRQRRSMLLLLLGVAGVMVSLLAYWGWRMARAQRALRTLSECDPLTGISNRRHFRARTEAALAEAKNRGQPVGLLLLDLDHFKSINDQAGHEVGDRVLVEIARIARIQCGRFDAYGRLGGEEYGICLPGRSLAQTQAFAERLLGAIRRSDCYAHNDGRPVTASIGASCTDVVGYGYEALMRAADAAMYRAKGKGRDRVEIDGPATAIDVQRTRDMAGVLGAS